MIGDPEEIIRLNVERFETLLGVEADPERRRLLNRALSEMRAELEFLTEKRGLETEQRDGQVSEKRIRHFRRKAEECRSAIRAHDNQSTREVFLLLAEQYEAVADDAESMAGQGPAGSGGSE